MVTPKEEYKYPFAVMDKLVSIAEKVCTNKISGALDDFAKRNILLYITINFPDLYERYVTVFGEYHSKREDHEAFIERYNYIMSFYIAYCDSQAKKHIQ